MKRDHALKPSNGSDLIDSSKASRGLKIAWRRVLPSLSRITALLLIVSFLTMSSPAAAIAQTGDRVYLPSVSNVSAPILRGNGDWPMAGGNPQRTSWTSAEVRGELKPEWYTHFDAYISMKVQIIAANNTLYISAADGLHALNSDTGREKWLFPTSLPLGNAPTYLDKVVYVGGLDRNMYALNADTGQELWRFRAEAGFVTNPLVANGLVLAGNRDSYFYAINAQTGQLVWRFKTDGPILFSAAFQDNAVYFASNDMYAYALDVSTGNRIWKSAKLPGAGFHSWWPVVYDNYVIFSGAQVYRNVGPVQSVNDAPPTHVNLEKTAYPSNVQQDDLIGPEGREPGNWATGTRTINAARISEYYETYPYRRTTVLLERGSGREYTYDSDRDGRPEYAPFLYQGTYSGTRYPAVVGPDNVIYQANNYIYNPSIPWGQITGWKFGTSHISIPTERINAVDEPLAYAIGGNTMYWKLCCDRVAASFDIRTGANTNYFSMGGLELRRFFPELYDQAGWEFSYWKHGDNTPPIPYNGRVYTINNNAVIAYSPYGRDRVIPPDSENLGSNTGVDPGALERGSTFTGLNTKLTQNNTSWPLLIQQERYFELRERADTRANHFSLFEVAGAASSNPTSTTSSNNAIASTITSNYSGGQFISRVSNRAPMLLFQNTGSTYQLRGRFTAFAYRVAGGAHVRTMNSSADVNAMSEGWLLAWDRTDTHRWVPVVISLQNRPTQIRLDGTGITLTFNGASGYLAVTPLYGMSAPRSNEQNTWPSGVPEATLARASALNRIAHAFPSSSVDAMNINGTNGDVELTYTYSYITFNDAWNTVPLPLAYLPPNLALAAWNGSPITVNGRPADQLTDLVFVTPLGRVAGDATTHIARVRLSGLANYWRQVPGEPSTPSGDPLQAKLIEEVQKMIQAGHLLPAYGKTGIWDTRASNHLGANLADYWHNPAETVYTLIRALPLLPTDLQNQVRQYLTREFASYPTHSISHVGWQAGAKRDAMDFPPRFEAARASFDPCGACNSWGFPAENPYASWMYAAEFGGGGTIFNATIPNFNLNPQFRQSFAFSLNSQIAGAIGYYRLAGMAGNAGAQAQTESALVNLFTLRAAYSKYPSALQAVGFEFGGYRWALRTFAPNMPDTIFSVRTMGTLWNQLPLYGFTMDPTYGGSGPGTGGSYAFGIDYVNMVPEQASFMRAYAGAEEQAAIADHERRTPYWFVSKSEEAAGEGVIHPIYESIALFNAKAKILRAGRADLEQYLDAPVVPVGDLYYMQKLIQALEAGR